MNREPEQANKPDSFMNRCFNQQARAKAKAMCVAAAWNVMHGVACTATVSGLVLTSMFNALTPITGGVILLAALAAEISGWYLQEQERKRGNPDYQPIHPHPQKPPKF